MSKTASIGIPSSCLFGLAVTYGLRKLDIRRLYSYGAGMVTVPVGIMLASVIFDRDKGLTLAKFKQSLGTWDKGPLLIAALDRVKLPEEMKFYTNLKNLDELDEEDGVFIFDTDEFWFSLTKQDLISKQATSEDYFVNLLEFDLASLTSDTFANFLQIYLGTEATTRDWTFEPKTYVSDVLMDNRLTASTLTVREGACLKGPEQRSCSLYWEVAYNPEIDRWAISVGDVIRVNPHFGPLDSSCVETETVEWVRSEGKKAFAAWLEPQTRTFEQKT